jgi:uncharacterized lipoprotein YmbA
MKRRWTLPLAGLLLGTVLLTGCGYPEVSPQTYAIAKALYSVCNQKNPERLKTVQELIQKSLEKEEISAREADWLKAIIAQAEAGEWETALLETRQMMEDQTGR